MSGRRMSSTNTARPVSFCGPSRRGSERPTDPASLMRALDLMGALDDPFNGGDERGVSGTSAHIAGQAFANLGFTRRRLLVEQAFRGQHEAGDAEAALHAGRQDRLLDG